MHHSSNFSLIETHKLLVFELNIEPFIPLTPVFCTRQNLTINNLFKRY